MVNFEAGDEIEGILALVVMAADRREGKKETTLFAWRELWGRQTFE